MSNSFHTLGNVFWSELIQRDILNLAAIFTTIMRDALVSRHHEGTLRAHPNFSQQRRSMVPRGWKRALNCGPMFPRGVSLENVSFSSRCRFFRCGYRSVARNGILLSIEYIFMTDASQDNEGPIEGLCKIMCNSYDRKCIFVPRAACLEINSLQEQSSTHREIFY